jgi:IMP dehydrogenase
MDAVTDANFAILMSKRGGLAVLNLEGVQTRYDNPEEVLAQIAKAPVSEVTPLLQKIYSQPIKPNLIGERIQAIKKAGAVCAISIAPANTKRLAPLAAEAGADILVVQSTVTTARHMSKSYRGLIFEELRQSLPIPIVVGNCVSYNACLELMRTGIAGVLGALMALQRRFRDAQLLGDASPFLLRHEAALIALFKHAYGCHRLISSPSCYEICRHSYPTSGTG